MGSMLCQLGAEFGIFFANAGIFFSASIYHNNKQSQNIQIKSNLNILSSKFQIFNKVVKEHPRTK